MKKIQFKLTRRQLMIWLNFVEGVARYSDFNSDTLSKMFVANIKELVHSLQSASRVTKVKYTLSIVESQCLAFHFLIMTTAGSISDSDSVTLNEILGHINMKTI